tara:strand:+ start:5830 stop:6708 length:879 start_codon:yes stop_codon:yes gene_type:complete
MACGSVRKDNVTRAFAGARKAVELGAQVICLQELFAHEYFCQVEDSHYFDLAEPIPGPLTEEASGLAKQFGIVLVVPIFEKRAAGVYHNSAAVIDATGEIVGVYRKMHIPDDPQYFEKYYFAPGDLGYRVFNTQFAKLGVLICWDQWYPEAARLSTLGGAELLLYPTAIGWVPGDSPNVREGQQNAWSTVQQGHAITNGVYVATVNRVGHEDSESGGLDFWGRSFICDPTGHLLASASDTHGDVVVTNCSREVLEEQRRAWPFLRDRRIDSYAGLSKRFLENSELEPSKSAK